MVQGTVTAQPVISAGELRARVAAPAWRVVDCRFSLADPDSGRRAYAAGHIPGALYAHLDDDLSGPVGAGSGRHPLPEPDVLAATLGSWGIDADVQVVAYDDAGGAIAARLWWLLGWLGHDKASVLDGGWPAWVASGAPVETSLSAPPAPRRFESRTRHGWVVDAAAVDVLRRAEGAALFDARAPARYRGEDEPIDPVAGHIPGAESAPFRDNLAPDGTFKPPAELRQRFEELLAGRAAEEAVFYCGSGVTAAHDLLALSYAGLPPGRLYAGSWSEWIADPARPVER